jgi:hypothetical protein
MVDLFRSIRRVVAHDRSPPFLIAPKKKTLQGVIVETGSDNASHGWRAFCGTMPQLHKWKRSPRPPCLRLQAATSRLGGGFFCGTMPLRRRRRRILAGAGRRPRGVAGGSPPGRRPVFHKPSRR